MVFIFGSKRTLNTNDIINLLHDIAFDDKMEGADVYIDPPDDGNVSDGDSGEEDLTNFDQLSRRQLLAPAEVNLRRNQYNEDLNDDNGDEGVLNTLSTSSTSTSSMRTAWGTLEK